jgi:cation transport ATPase
MVVFNAVYYSFSPQVARTISANENLRTMMRYLLYPLIGILWATQQIYSAFAFGPEGAVVIAGLFAGSLIGLVYASPVILGISFAIARAFRRRPTRVHVYMLLPFLAIATSLIIVSELTRFEMLMQFSTSLLMLTTWALPGIALSAWALNRHRPVAG